MKSKIEKLKESTNEVGEVINYEAILKRCRVFDYTELLKVLNHNKSIFWSWGSHNFILDSVKDTRMFRMTVNGRYHKGHVYIFVNASDLFEVYLTTNHGKIVKKTDVFGIYFDVLVDWIDCIESKF